MVIDKLKNLEKRGRNVIRDNFFTTLNSVNLFKQKYLTDLGTTRKKSEEDTTITFDYKRTSEKYLPFSFNERGTMVSYVSKKGKVVTFISTLHKQPEIDAPEMIGNP